MNPDGIDPPAILVLPEPAGKGRLSVEEALARRRSVRRYTGDPLSPGELSQLLWSLQGITAKTGERTAPSAGALYPLEVYAVLPEGCFHYDPRRHLLVRRKEGDLRGKVYQASLQQDQILQAPATFVLAAVFSRIEREYGVDRAPRYVFIEIGHAAQNLHLQAVALGLDSVPIGAFHEDRLQDALGLPADHEPLYLVPVGKRGGAGRR